MTADELTISELEDLFYRRGKFTALIFGGPMHTYPNGDDNHRLLHAACVELASRGKIRETTREIGHSCWVRIDDPQKWGQECAE